jgi:hypothetical protein
MRNYLAALNAKMSAIIINLFQPLRLIAEIKLLTVDGDPYAPIFELRVIPGNCNVSGAMITHQPSGSTDILGHHPLKQRNNTNNR